VNYPDKEEAIMHTGTQARSARDDSLVTRALAGLCHHCGICPYAATRPDSILEKTMRWHRTWCPAWKAHTLVYGPKPLPSRRFGV
jgi:hypothetical protein